MKTIIVSLLVLLLLFAGASAIRADQLQGQAAPLAAQREAIEKAYVTNLAQIKEEAELWAQKIPVIERILWADFFRMHGQFTYTDKFLSDSIGDFVQSPPAFRLRTDMVDSFFTRAAANFLLDYNAYKLLDQIVNSNTEPYRLRSYAQQLLPIMEDLQMQLAQTENKKNAAIARLEMPSEMQFETPSNEGTGEEPGKVSIICVSKNGEATAAIEGVDNPVRAGDSMGNIKVAAITATTVTFIQNNTAWTQAVGQSPNSCWAKAK